jgi:UDP-2,3-diacylglucosamine pyrophosphatase LpxH
VTVDEPATDTSHQGSLGHDSELDRVRTMNLERVQGGRVYFVSDLHLGDGSHADIFLQKDEHFLAFLDEVERHGTALVIVGDAMDFEQAWYFSRILRAHRQVISRLTRLTHRMRVIYVYGNHDPDIVLFRDILNWQLCDKVVVDGDLLAVHGYEFDSYVGKNFEESSFLTKAIGLYERVFRTWLRLPLRNFYTLSGRLAHYLFYWAVRASRGQRWLAERFGWTDWGRGFAHFVDFWTRTALGDPMGITMPAIESLRDGTGGHSIVVCGHSHLPGIVQVDDDKAYVNLGSWSFGNSQYGIWDGVQFELRDWITGRTIRDEHYRPIFEGKADRTYEEWFESEYLGYLRFRCGEEGLRQGVRPPSWALAGLGPPTKRRVERIETRREVEPEETPPE